MSFTRLAKRVVLANRVKKQFDPSNRSHLSTTRGSDQLVTSLPTTLTERIPQELYERIIDHLSEDVPALLACCVVCRAWVPACKYHLFGSRLIIRPLELTGTTARVNCAKALNGKQTVLYGTDDGIYMSSPVSRSSLVPALFIPAVTQIDVLEHCNILIILSEQYVFTAPLASLDHLDPKTSSVCTRISSHATFFKLGHIMGKNLLCVVKAGMTTTTCKLFEPISSHSTKLRLYKEFYISERVVSVDFLRTRIVAGTSHHDFEIVDVETLNAQPLLDPSTVLPKVKSNKCLAVLRIGHEVLLCYSVFAAYVDTQGKLIRRPPIRWQSGDIGAVVLREPYMLAFGSEHMEVYHIYTGALHQIVRVATTILSLSPGCPIVQTRDGRIIGLRFLD